jgi:PPP family 3-phenylpropionic acid transporter
MNYWRLSGFYLFYFASLGALVPYWSLYLKSLGFGITEIGQLIAILMATKIVAPNVWGWIADHTGRRMTIVRAASLLGVLAFAGVFLGSGYWWLVLVMSVFSFFWNASLPQFEATTMNHLGEDTWRYSSIRLWGSVGFIVAVVLLGPLLDRYGAGLLPAVVLALFAGIWISSLLVPESAAGHLPLQQGPLREVLGRPFVISLLLVCFLMQASHGPYYAFFTIYLEDFGYSRALIGQLWGLGVVAEIVVFLVMSRLLPRALYASSLGVVLFAQTLHAASFGVYHAVAIYLIHRLFTGTHQGRGQALYSSVSFGAGGAIGSLVSGYLWNGINPPAMFLLAAAASLTALLVILRGMRGEY